MIGFVHGRTLSLAFDMTLQSCAFQGQEGHVTFEASRIGGFWYGV